MKKTIALVGLAAFSASTLHAQYAPDLTPTEKAKIWSVSATLRGFYDDNVTTLPRGVAPIAGVTQPSAKDSVGIWFSPSVGLNHTGDATTITGRYTYDLKYYGNPGFTDQSHQLDAKLDHSFSERYNLKVSESFVVAQEPTVLDNSVLSTPLRSNGDNIRNTGKIDFTAELTKLFAVQIGYQNSLYMYKQNASDISSLPEPAVPPPGFIAPFDGRLISRSAELDRMEHLATVNLLWRPVENTTGRLGYQYGQTEFTSPEVIIYNPLGAAGPDTHANVRNQRSHFFYIGVDQNFTPELTAQVRIGGQYLDYYHTGHSQVSPYVDASLRYAYAEGSYVQAGIRHIHNATDIVGTVFNNPVLDEESTAVYLRGNQKIASRLNLNWLGQYQHSTVNGGGGGFDGKVENFWVGQLNLSYQINNFVSAETGYEYDRLISDFSRGYYRDQVYIGVRATY